MSTALERIEALLDPGTFQRMDDLEPSIHLLGAGTVAGRKIYCCSGVAEPQRVDLLECFHRKIKWLEGILADPSPVVWLHDAPAQAPGGRTPIPACADELLASNTSGVGRVFCLQARLNGIAPQFSALFGDAGAAQTFPVRLADFTLLKEGTHLWIGRPDAVRLMLAETADPEKLGGAEMHCKTSGVGDVLFRRDDEALQWIRKAIGLIPSLAGDPLPRIPGRHPVRPCGELADIVPADLNKTFDMRIVINALVDADSWIGYQELHAREILVGLARIDGIPVGILANNSIRRGGVLFPESCRKMKRFIRFCDNYRIPLIFLADNPGMMVGTSTEQGGMLNEASGLLQTLATLRTPRACLVIRKAYTVGLYAMAGPGFDPSAFWATPHASISVFGPKALDGFAADRDLPEPARAAIDAMRHHALDPRDYEKKGYLSAVIDWHELRDTLLQFARRSSGDTA